MDIWGLTAEVYKLVATKSGYYDVYEWGNSSPIGKTWLNSAKSSFQDFETSRIKKFEKQFGYKPAGNKCYH